MTSLQNKEEHDFNHILIIGLGVMGGSFARSLDVEGRKLYGIDKNVNIYKQVQEEVNISFIDYEDLKTIPTIDMVIVTAMPSQVVSVLKRLNDYLDEQTLVIEISGIKLDLVASLKEKKWRFPLVLTHPMAGRESGGFAFSRKGLFIGANMLIIEECNTANDEQMLQLEALFLQLGVGKILYMSAKNHDAHITYTSQLSHVIASSLILSSDYDEKTKYTIGDSFRDLTRIANMNVPMWQDL